MRKGPMAVFFLVAAAYGAIAGLAWTFQRSIIFPAPRERVEPSLPGATLIRLRRSRVVHCFYVPAPHGAPTVVHFHGNGESLATVASIGTSFGSRGVGFFAVEYPGYGLSSDSSPSEIAIYEDAAAALTHLRDELRVRPESIVLQGQSLGTGVAVEMARRGFGARLVLISPYTSIPDMAKRALPFLPMGLLVRDRFDNASKVRGIAIPTLVVHGTDDEVIPFSMGERIASLLPNARFLRLPGAHHNDVWEEPSLEGEIVSFARGDS
jgi:uncharacterized protein